MKGRILLLAMLFFSSLLGPTEPTLADHRLYDQALAVFRDNPSKALQITDSLLSVKASNLPRWRILILQAKIYLHLRDVTSAQKKATEADLLYREAYHQPQSEIQSVLAIAYKDQGDLVQSLHFYQLAVDSSRDTMTRLNNLFNMAEIEMAAGDTASAAEHLRSNMGYVYVLHDSGFKGYCLLQYARFLFDTDPDLRKTLITFKYAATILEKSGELQNAGFAKVGIGKTYGRMGKPDSCAWWLAKALETQTQNNRPLGLADAFLAYGDYRLSINQPDIAISMYLKAIDQAKKANYLPLTEAILKQLAIAYEQINDYAKGNKYLKLYNSLKDSIGRHEWLHQLSELQIKYAVTQKDRKIKQLQKDETFSSAILWVLGGFSLIGFGVASIRFYEKKKRKSQDTKSQEKDESNKAKSFSKERAELWEKLLTSLENEKLFKDPNLNLNGLAQHLHTNRTTLSEVINAYGNQSFNNLINHYRIQEARLLLGDQAYNHLSVEGIGTETGFKSRSAFYTAFNQEQGETPSSFRKRVQQENQRENVKFCPD